MQTPQRWSPKNNLIKNKNNTLRLTQSNQWVGVDHAARIHLLNFPPMTGIVQKNKMIVMMAMMI